MGEFLNVVQNFSTHPTVHNLSSSGTFIASSNLPRLVTSIGPVTCCPFSSICFTQRYRAFSTSGLVTIRGLFQIMQLDLSEGRLDPPHGLWQTSDVKGLIA